jgi:hypothetical protein
LQAGLEVERLLIVQDDGSQEQLRIMLLEVE